MAFIIKVKFCMIITTHAPQTHEKRIQSHYKQIYRKYLVANAPAVLEKQIPSLSDPQIFKSRSCAL